MIPITECRTGAEVRALARKVHSSPSVPVVRLGDEPCALPPPTPPTPVWPAPATPVLSYSATIRVELGALSGPEPVYVSLTDMRVRVRVKPIIRATAEHFGVPESSILGASREPGAVRPRQVAMYLARALTGLSYPDIGRRMGDKDHTTIIHAVKKINRLLPIDPELAAAIAAVKDRLGVR